MVLSDGVPFYSIEEILSIGFAGCGFNRIRAHMLTMPTSRQTILLSAPPMSMCIN